MVEAAHPCPHRHRRRLPGRCSAAVTLRELGYAGELKLIGEEADLPYERPPLSKAVLIGDADEPDWVRDEAFYADHQIELLRGTTVTRVDPARHVVVAGGAEHGYDKLLLATGSTPRRLEIPGADLDGVFTLRTFGDSLALRERFTAGAQVVVVGAGWIGCESAAAARQRGATVTVVEPLSQPLLKVVGEQVGTTFAALHREHNVDLRLGYLGARLRRRTARCLACGCRTASRSRRTPWWWGWACCPTWRWPTPPDWSWPRTASRSTRRCVPPTRTSMRPGTSPPRTTRRTARRVRVEHWANAKDQGEHVAGNLLGAAAAYEKRPFFFSDQYDLGCEYRGLADPERDRLVVRGDLAQREYMAFWLRDGAVAAALNVNMWDDGDALQDLVDSGRSVEVNDLVSGSLS